jgi:hypothetical protein
MGLDMVLSQNAYLICTRPWVPSMALPKIKPKNPPKQANKTKQKNLRYGVLVVQDLY